MAKVHISPKAKEDLIDIREYILNEFDSPSAAANTVKKIMKSIRRLSSFPDIGAPLASIIDFPNDYRFLVCGNYLVFYRYEAGNVHVVRILYGRRDYMKILFDDASEDNAEHIEYTL